MTFDLLPFSAFALESSSATAQAMGESYTLTLPLDLEPAHPAFEPANGRVELTDPAFAALPAQRAAVVPADGPVLTITF